MMKKPPVDYRGFRLSKINDPAYSHIWLLLGWVFYFVMYFLTENLIPPESCAPVHCALDDKIPFCEYFLVFYVGWYLLVFGSLAWYFFTDVENFRKLQTYIIITQVLAMAAYILFPSRQDLRPEVFARDNLFTHAAAFIYSFDTSTGVCPSLHVAYSLGILSVFWRDRDASRLWKAALTVLVVMICLSVCFVKQHSALDVLAALPVCAVAEACVFWLPKLRQRNRAKK